MPYSIIPSFARTYSAAGVRPFAVARGMVGVFAWDCGRNAELAKASVKPKPGHGPTQRANIRRMRYADRRMGARACTVSFIAATGIRHSVEVTAESLYEAAILGVSLL